MCELDQCHRERMGCVNQISAHTAPSPPLHSPAPLTLLHLHHQQQPQTAQVHCATKIQEQQPKPACPSCLCVHDGPHHITPSTQITPSAHIASQVLKASHNHWLRPPHGRCHWLRGQRSAHHCSGCSWAHAFSHPKGGVTHHPIRAHGWRWVGHRADATTAWHER